MNLPRLQPDIPLERKVIMQNIKLQEKYQLFIGGEWRDASDGGTFTTACPANGEKLAVCAQATQADVDAAVKAAWKAFDAWKNIPATQRAGILNKSLILSKKIGNTWRWSKLWTMASRSVNP